MSEADQQSAAAAPAPVGDEVVAKYKKLLNLARTNLEANQATIATKDQQIQQLHVALEEEKLKSSKRAPARDDDVANVPRRILCRVEVFGVVWVLFEYETEDNWKSFQDEQSLQDFIQRIPGVPLICPPQCLSAEDSVAITDEAKKKVDRIVEEFRRYKVRTEIARKQKDAETKQHQSSISAGIGGITNSQNNIYSPSLSASLEKAMSVGMDAAVSRDSGVHSSGSQCGGGATQSEAQLLRKALADQEKKSKEAYDLLSKENEMLRNKGNEALLATQWRLRYEACMKEKQDISEKLMVFTEMSNGLNNSGKTIEQAYVDLQDEFKEFRRKVISLEKKRAEASARSQLHTTPNSKPNPYILSPAEIDSLEIYETKGRLSFGKPKGGSGSSSSSSSSRGNKASSTHGTAASSFSSSSDRGGDDTPDMASPESKLNYIRHMVVQYLTVLEAEVKLQLENAMIIMFRLNEEEKAAIETRRKFENEDALASITGLFDFSLPAFS